MHHLFAALARRLRFASPLLAVQCWGRERWLNVQAHIDEWAPPTS